MPHPKKKQRVTGDEANYSVGAAAASANDLSVDVLANILGFLCAKDIMPKRRVCKKWSEAVKKTIVPLVAAFDINSVEKYNAANVMIRAMPNLQHIKLCTLGYEHLRRGNKYNDGEDPDEEEAARYADYTTYDIEIISNFCKLRILEIGYDTRLNGRYPVLFNSFPLLQKLSINNCYYLKWDLEMLAGLPSLKELACWHNHSLTGNINSLVALKDTLEKVKVYAGYKVEGNFMDLKDFPHLKELDLRSTAVTGDIRHIGENDFSSIEQLALPKGVYGGAGYEFQHISDAPDLIRAIHIFKKQRPVMKLEDGYGILSRDSPDWYSADDDDDSPLIDTPPFHVRFVEAGSRVGYRWETNLGIPCEVNWLDPEPESGSIGYEDYIERLQEIQGEVGFYRGYHQPPTEEEYNRLLDRFEEEGRWW